MSVARLFMMLGMCLLPVGLIYGMSFPEQGMTVELTCLAAGAAIFLTARMFERRGTGTP